MGNNTGNKAKADGEVPHAKCPRQLPLFFDEETMTWVPRHRCDFTALSSARVLARALTQAFGARNIEIQLIAGDIERRYCDLNRQSCRYAQGRPTRFRDELRLDIQQALARRQASGGATVIWLFDVHSFPPNQDSYGYPDTELVLLDNLPGGRRSISPWTVALTRFLRQHPARVSVRVLKGQYNDINDEAFEQGLSRVFLVEFNEGLADDRRAEIAGAMADFVRATTSTTAV